MKSLPLIILLLFLFTGCGTPNDRSQNVEQEPKEDNSSIEVNYLDLEREFWNLLEKYPYYTESSQRGVAYEDSGWKNGKRTVTIAEHIVESWICTNTECSTMNTQILDEKGLPYELNSLGTNTTYSQDHSFMIYQKNLTLYQYNFHTRVEAELITLPDTTEGVDLKISPDSSKIAVVLINLSNENYKDSAGTKLFVFNLDENRRVIDSQSYDIPIDYGYSDQETLYTKSFFIDDTNKFFWLTPDYMFNDPSYQPAIQSIQL